MRDNRVAVNTVGHASHIRDNWQFSPQPPEICYANEGNLFFCAPGPVVAQCIIVLLSYTRIEENNIITLVQRFEEANEYFTRNITCHISHYRINCVVKLLPGEYKSQTFLYTYIISLKQKQ